MDKLIINLTKVNNPYLYEKSSKNDLWGKIVLCYGEILLLDIEWNISGFIEWFYNSLNKLNKDIFPFYYYNTIAESRDILYNRYGFENEEKEDLYYKELENYFHFHYLKIRGTDTNGFYIGLIDNTKGGISWKNDKIYYSHYFIIDEFIEETITEINEFIKEYSMEESDKK
jgi:hypothetical protein